MRLLENVSLRKLQLMGCVASVVLTVVSCVRGWPFPALHVAPWVFEVPLTNSFLRYTALTIYFISLATLGLLWLQVMQRVRAQELSTRMLWHTFAFWVTPLLFSTPLSSGDVYVYYVDGQAIARGFDLYVEGISSLGAAPMVNLVHPLWRDTNTMYGPVFMRMTEAIARLFPASIVLGVGVFRLVTLAGCVAAAFALKRIAQFCEWKPTYALAFFLLNPITLVHLISGAHNDALMIAFVAVGLCCALHAQQQTDRVRAYSWLLVAIVCCSLSGAFKIPGFAGVFIIGWIWSGRRAPLFKRLVLAGLFGLIGAGVFVLQSKLAGLGWGWINASKVPGLARPLLAPANAFGIAIDNMVVLHGKGVDYARMVGTACAIVLSVVFVLRTHADATPARVIRAFGFALLAIGWLGPAVYPWYLAWGASIACAVGFGRMQRLQERIMAFVVLLVLPAGYGLLDIPSGLPRVAIAWFVCGAIIVLILYASRLFKSMSKNRTTPPELRSRSVRVS